MTKLAQVLLIIFLLTSCKKAAINSVSQERDELIAETAGPDYSSKIRIPVSAFDQVDTTNNPKIEFDNPIFQFDTITEGEIVKHTFMFKNSGKSDLFILDARVSCGCTVASYPKDAIPPNEIGEINVTFDSQNKKKNQNKNIIIISNTYPNETSISLDGFVKEKK